MENTGIFPDGSFPGVILWPEVRPVPVLVSPVPSSVGAEGAFSRSFTIPFGGEYWFYRWPFYKPPPNSFFQKGSPAALSFSTTDRRPLAMEARQKLEQTLSLSCCRKLQVYIWNADLYPGTIRLDVSLIGEGMSWNIGQVPVRSAPALTRRVVAVSEMLEFSFPAAASGTFNEFQVVFRRNPNRASKSARIAIDRFVLVP
jgi:hypothetical protein